MAGQNVAVLGLLLLLFFLSFAEHYGGDEKVYVLFGVDTELDLVPVLNTTSGLDAGTSYLLDVFKRYGVRATFFVTGRVAILRPQLVRAISMSGHEVCGHAFEHENFSGLDYGSTQVVVERTISAISGASNISIRCFRAPYQLSTKNLVEALEEQGILSEGSFLASYPELVNNTRVLRISSAPLFYPSTVYPDSWVGFFEKTLDNQKYKRVKVVVIGLHPWELVSMPKVSGFEEYTTPSGEYSRRELEILLSYLVSKNISFVSFSDFRGLFFGDY